jgi:predicted HTH domain antitoxin
MEITVHLPDDLAQRPNPGREALESLAIEGYRTGALTHYQASQMLGLSRIEFDGFLKERQIYEHAYGVEEFQRDLRTIEDDLQRRVEQYSMWLRECPGAEDFSITPTDENGTFPFQWKVVSGSDPSHFVGYVILKESRGAHSDAEIRRLLCERLEGAVREAREAGRAGSPEQKSP